MDDQNKIFELETKIKQLEDKLNSSMVFDDSLLKRAIGIFGHNLLGQIILFLPIMILLGIIVGFLSSLFFPSGFDQGW